MTRDAQSDPIILFDGVCGLCNRAVRFIVRHDRAGQFRFAHLQSAVGRSLADGTGLSEPLPDSVLLVEGDTVCASSDAALAIARRLDGRWSALRWFGILPRGLRDAGYRWIARHRYRWFGRSDACQVPTPDLATRFIAGGEGPATQTEDTQ